MVLAKQIHKLLLFVIHTRRLFASEREGLGTRLAFDSINISFHHSSLLEKILFVHSTIQVVLEPGDILFVPRHWWHYVESVGEKTTVSINTWVDQVSVASSWMDACTV